MNDLDSYFKYLISPSITKDLNLKRNYDGYEKLIRKYWAYYNESTYYDDIFKLNHITEIYEWQIRIAAGCTYNLRINIDKLKDTIKNIINSHVINQDLDYNTEYRLDIEHDDKDIPNDTDISEMQFLRSFIELIIDENSIDKNYARKCVNNSDPIICGDFKGLSPNKRIMIVDGNHRAYAKIKANHDTINGYLISRNVWFKALLTEQDKRFIKIITNTNSIISYRCGLINKGVIEQNMYKI